jgi:hypothetical protein
VTVITTGGSDLVIDMDAYVHVSEGVSGVEPVSEGRYVEEYPCKGR